jgi:integrase/recombinase XerD
MPYQFKREPLLPEEATRLAQACQTVREKLVIWTLLDTGLRVSELANLTATQIDGQGHRLTIDGKGGPYGSRSKRRIIPLSARLQSLIAHHFALQDTIGLTPRAMQLLVKRVANRARISRPVTPHVLRHTFAVTAVQKGISLPAVTVDEGIAPPASAAKPCVRVSTSHGSSNVQCLSDRPSALVRRLRHVAVPM